MTYFVKNYINANMKLITNQAICRAPFIFSSDVCYIGKYDTKCHREYSRNGKHCKVPPRKN